MTLIPQDPNERLDENAAVEVEELEEDERDGFDLGNLLAQAQNMQQQLLDAQAEVAAQVVEGQSGGGVVRVRVTGGFDFQSVHIDPAAVDPADVEMLQDLVLAAVRDALSKVNELNSRAMGGLGSALGGLIS